MEVMDLARVREETAAAVRREITGWDVKLAKLEGISEGLMGRGKGVKPANVIMARKLCCYYMRNEGFTFQQIGRFLGYTNHCTPLHHYNDCKNFLENPSFSDRDYQKAHKLAKENGIW